MSQNLPPPPLGVSPEVDRWIFLLWKMLNQGTIVSTVSEDASSIIANKVFGS